MSFAQSMDQEITKYVLNIKGSVVILCIQQHAESFDLEIASFYVI